MELELIGAEFRDASDSILYNNFKPPPDSYGVADPTVQQKMQLIVGMMGMPDEVFKAFAKVTCPDGRTYTGEEARTFLLGPE